MKSKSAVLSERRREIVAEIGKIPVLIEGTLSERRRKRGGAEARVYHQLQRWRGGGNDTRHVPAAAAAAVKEGVEGYRRAQALISELASLDEAALLAPSGAGKKKPARPTGR